MMSRWILLGGVIALSFALVPHAFAADTVDHDTSVDLIGNDASGHTTQVEGELAKPFTVVSSISFRTFKDATVTVFAPATGDAFVPGTSHDIRWEWDSQAMSAVNLFYSKDGGATYTAIATNVPNRGYYAWNVPDVVTEHAKVLVQGTDGLDVFVEDVSDEFTILGTVEYGTSPVDGTTEELADVDAGQVVMSPSFSETYYVAEDGTRRPFIDTQSMYTYIRHADDVAMVTDATVASLALGAPMLPKSGTVLVKEAISPDVYLVTGDVESPVIRHITSERIAAEMFGEDWADYVIDVPPTVLVRYARGEAIDRAIMVDTSGMRKRETLQ
ncbi:hypothetical protein HYS28_02705 [Candidatus Uhrbacteria bacterium]|nr:hypothetical protein [Candidatus Uhrbacteria bacterium]